MHQRVNSLFVLEIQFLFFLLISLITYPVFAHGGRTNAEGCHNNLKTGEYHCHNGGAPQAKSVQPVAMGCERQPRCYELTSCANALHYFSDCGMSELDRDNDGVPSESICGHH